jgi:hypothetical protein
MGRKTMPNAAATGTETWLFAGIRKPAREPKKAISTYMAEKPRYAESSESIRKGGIAGFGSCLSAISTSKHAKPVPAKVKALMSALRTWVA